MLGGSGGPGRQAPAPRQSARDSGLIDAPVAALGFCWIGTQCGIGQTRGHSLWIDGAHGQPAQRCQQPARPRCLRIATARSFGQALREVSDGQTRIVDRLNGGMAPVHEAVGSIEKLQGVFDQGGLLDGSSMEGRRRDRRIPPRPRCIAAADDEQYSAGITAYSGPGCGGRRTAKRCQRGGAR